MALEHKNGSNIDCGCSNFLPLPRTVKRLSPISNTSGLDPSAVLGPRPRAGPLQVVSVGSGKSHFGLRVEKLGKAVEVEDRG